MMASVSFGLRLGGDWAVAVIPKLKATKRTMQNLGPGQGLVLLDPRRLVFPPYKVRRERYDPMSNVVDIPRAQVKNLSRHCGTRIAAPPGRDGWSSHHCLRTSEEFNGWSSK